MSIIFHDSNIRCVSLPSTARLKMHKIKEEESKKYQRILHIASSKKMLGIQKFFEEVYEPELQLDLSAMNMPSVCFLNVRGPRGYVPLYTWMFKSRSTWKNCPFVVGKFKVSVCIHVAHMLISCSLLLSRKTARVLARGG